MSENHDRDIFEDAIQRLDRAFRYAEIDQEAVERLKHPKQILQVAIPVRMDDGSLRVFTGSRSGPPQDDMTLIIAELK